MQTKFPLPNLGRRPPSTVRPRPAARPGALFREPRLLLASAAMLITTLGTTAGSSEAQTLPNPVLFVTQVPVRPDFATIGSTFANHMTGVRQATRGGDLWIRYTDGTLKNLTATAGYGSTAADGFQGADSIAVRDPSVHWDGNKAIFSMVVGGPAVLFEQGTWYWQLYEITGLGPSDTPVVTKVANQPLDANNIMPIYGTDDRVIFVSDRSPTGAPHLYPQLDEYESTPTNSGLWSLDPVGGDLFIMNHAPSGDFTPTIDSYGRVVFTQWDHLQRDQQADAQAHQNTGMDCDNGLDYGMFNYDSEDSASAYDLNDISEVFPEPRGCRTELLAGTGLNGHRFNHFFPWTILEDGSDGEVLSHLGRHELHDYLNSSRNDDPNVIEYYGQYPRTNPNSIENFFQIKEDPTTPGRYYGVEAPEFQTHASGQVIRIDAQPSLDADNIVLTYITHPDTAGTGPSPDHSGHYRDPLPMSDGQVVAAHTTETGPEASSGPTNAALYEFRLMTVTEGTGGVWSADLPLTAGISKTVRYYSPDVEFVYTGNLWELNPVEVRSRTRPTASFPAIAAPEQQMFDAAGVTVAEMIDFLTANDLALVVSRDVTIRDDADIQQPYNLRVPGGVESIVTSGTVYDVPFMQFFQGDLRRGTTGIGGSTPIPGRRVLATEMHDPAAMANNPLLNGPEGSVAVGLDGSLAAFVPSRRALTWQLTDGAGDGVVRERYWVNFAPGEIRVCANCHGLSGTDHMGAGAPQNAPQALYDLLTHWKTAGLPVCDSEIAIEKPKLKARADGFSLKSSGRAQIPEPFSGVDPAVNGIRFVVGGLIDVTLPGGAPWAANAKNTKWKYRDPEGTRFGVRKATVKASRGRVAWKIQAKGGTANLPSPTAVETAVILGDPGECASIEWAGDENAGPYCTGDAERLNCR